ncbi:flagellar motor protein MotB [Paenibacillus sp. CMAA1364]
MSKKNRRHEEEEHADESWLLPYSDLMTLLLALFIVLYSMSAADAEKFEAMSEAFSAAFTSGSGVLEHTSAIPKDKATSDVSSSEKADAQKVTKSQQASLIRQEQIDLEKLKQQIDQYIQKNNLTTQLDTKLNNSQLMITISDTALFASGKATVKPESRQLANAISGMIQEFPDYDIIVAGHTDTIPIANSEYSSNWDLSSDRAIQFMKILLTNSRLDPKKFTPVGYGEYHPIVSNDTSANRATNRRVEISLIRKYQENNQTLKVTDAKN